MYYIELLDDRKRAPGRRIVGSGRSITEARRIAQKFIRSKNCGWTHDDILTIYEKVGDEEYDVGAVMWHRIPPYEADPYHPYDKFVKTAVCWLTTLKNGHTKVTILNKDGTLGSKVEEYD